MGLYLGVVAIGGAVYFTEATADPRRSPGSNVLLCGTVLLALVFVTNWFGAVWGEYPDLTGSTVWPYIEIMLSAVFSAHAVRLWRAAGGPGSPGRNG